MKNYHVFSLENQTFNPQLMTLKEAMNEIRHAAPFGIFNASTGRNVVIHLQRGFCFPLRTVQYHAERCDEIVKKYSSFNYHPQQFLL